MANSTHIPLRQLRPLVCQVGRKTAFQVRDYSRADLLCKGNSYDVRFQSKVKRNLEARQEAVAEQNGLIGFSYTPEAEGEHCLRILDGDKEIYLFHMFALPADIMRYRPYRGDLHIHTTYSDGRCSPAIRVMQARLIGLDFAAVTDHRRYPPSLEARRFAEDEKLDILMLRGQESHPDCPGGHIVAIETEGPVDELRSAGAESGVYASEYDQILAQVKARSDLPPDLNVELYAQTVWHIRKIHEMKGLAILAHPYWVSGQRFDLDRAVWHQCLTDGEMDAVELFGDVKPEDNNLAVQRHMDHLASGGKPYPVVGSSDTHSAELDDTFGRLFTLVFSEVLTAEGIRESILAGRSIACEVLDGQPFRAYGRFEWVEYGHFLWRCFFPEHLRLCALEAGLWFERHAGRAIPSGAIESLAEARRSLYEECWAG